MSDARTRVLVDEYFAIERRELTIGGLSAGRLAEAFGTPLFVYDAGILRRQLGALRKSLPGRIEIYYSVKANPNPAVIAEFVKAGAGLEIASAGEFLRGRAAGGVPTRMVFAGPGKTREELELVVREGIGEIHVESEEELDLLARLPGAKNVGVRFNPGPVAAGGALRMGGRPAPFGFDEERLDEVIGAIRSRPGLRFSGLHMFAGTQVLDARVLVAQWRHAVGVARHVAAMTGGPLATLDLGGGLGIPYFSHETALDLGCLRRAAADLFLELEQDPSFTDTRFIIEPGRFLAGPAGVYLCRVLSVKHSRGSTFVIVDGGMHHHLAASGNLGQVMKRDFPIVNASRVRAEPLRASVVVGPLCTPLDTIGRGAPLPDMKPGELVAVLQSGAYGLSASPVGFLSHPTPAEVLVDGGEAHIIRERGTFAKPLTPLP
ncbi:MAG TPA: type III PLP-dependent enzyme [Candidatus Methylomirabilis sp.]|nr:type III PLP-dependent enzyme [Candidatus Methylomirabilis sp.]